MKFDVMEINGKFIRLSKLRDACILAKERGYYITEDGKLFSKRGLREKFSKYKGYYYFSISAFPGSPSGVFGIAVHKFAAYCFYGEEAFEKGKCVRHLNGHKTDNSKSNLRIGSYSENERDKSSQTRHRSATLARQAQGYRAHNAKLNDEQVRRIRQLLVEGLPQTQIAKTLNISKQIVWHIKKGEHYKDVT